MGWIVVHCRDKWLRSMEAARRSWQTWRCAPPSRWGNGQNGCGSKPFCIGSHFGIGDSPPILELIVVVALGCSLGVRSFDPCPNEAGRWERRLHGSMVPNYAAVQLFGVVALQKEACPPC